MVTSISVWILVQSVKKLFYTNPAEFVKNPLVLVGLIKREDLFAALATKKKIINPPKWSRRVS